MIKTINLKIENESNEKEIFNSIRTWVLDNFQLETPVLIEVSGKNETIKFDMKEYKQDFEVVSNNIPTEIKEEKQEGL